MNNYFNKYNFFNDFEDIDEFNDDLNYNSRDTEYIMCFISGFIVGVCSSFYI